MDRTSLFLRLTPALGLSFALSLGAASSLTACGGGGGTGGSGGGSGGAGGSAAAGCFDYSAFDGTTPAVHFQADVLPILRGSCGISMSCHGNPSGPGAQHYYGPNINSADPTPAEIQAIFDQSVGVGAVDDPSIKVISAGKPEESFLLYKLDGDPSAASGEQVSCATLKCAADKSCGDSMPQFGPPIDAAKRDVIRRWIIQGAKND